MARIPDAELERLKTEIAVERLVTARGVTLERRGADLVGRCPFHPDREPSLVVTPSKNLWHCLGACRTGGSVVDWVMKAEGVSFRHAVELLRADFSPLAASRITKRSTVVKLVAPIEFDADDQAVLGQVVAYYHETLKQSPEALAYLESRGLQSAEAIERFKLGFANRTLGYRLPLANRAAGAEIRGRLQKLGILRESGHEHFTGSLVVPIFDEAGAVTEIYGRKITPGLRPGTPLHMYLPGPHRGVWNLEAVESSKELILCEALIDALTFWCAGYRNVTASYGVEGFTPDHLAAMKRYGTERVLIAYDRDDAGERAAEALAAKLLASGIGCYRIHFPKGMDANEYAAKVKPADKTLGVLIRSALWLGKGKGPGPKMEREEEEEAVVEVETIAESETAWAAKNDAIAASNVRVLVEAELEPPRVESVAALPSAVEAAAAAPSETEPAASPEPPAPKAAEIPTEVKPEGEVVIRLGDRRYRARGLTKNLSFDTLKVNLLSALGEAMHVDTLDLYSARQRAAYVKQAAVEMGLEEELVKKDLGRVLSKLEELQEAEIRKTLEPKHEAVEIDDTERTAALELLRDPHLLERILADFERCGVVGEQTNKLVGYLAAVSRKLEEPLAVIIQSSSAAGKSSLMDAVLALVPEEERVKYSAMTGQSLFYMGETDLKGKVLAIVEEAGAERATYALKILQSEGELTIASTGKDPETGKLVTHEYRVEGPVAIFLTTTAVEIDEELLNRAIVLTVDEQREQTRAIHRLQRERQTLEGLLARRDRDEVLRLHQNAQRLLRPLLVANPYARSLTFFDSRTRTRRDHMKYLTLIRTIALLHQHQRPVRTVEHRGKLVEYVEVTHEDIATANRLAAEVLGRSLDELAPQTRRLLMELDAMAREECEKRELERADYRFSRRDVVERTGLGHTQVKLHLDRLVELEHVLVHHGGRGQSFVYELLYDGKGKDGEPFLSGLINTSAATAAAPPASGAATTIETSRGSERGFAGSSRAHDGAFTGGSRRSIEGPKPANGAAQSAVSPVSDAKRTSRATDDEPASYAQARRSDGVFPLAARVSLNTGGGF